MISEGGLFVQFYTLVGFYCTTSFVTPVPTLWFTFSSFTFFTSSGKTAQVQLLRTELQTAHISGGAQRALP